MYSVYNYAPGSTQANVLNDVVAILTGETDPANLTAIVKFSQASTNWSLGVGSGFSGLTPSAYVGQKVYTNGVLRGTVIDNDATTITINESYSASGVTAIVTTFEIYTDWAVAGWSLYDSSAGTNKKCIRAQYIDDASNYKYITIDTNTSNRILFGGYESWNNTSHTGSNLMQFSGSASYDQRVNLSSGGYLYISASARHLYLNSYQSGVWGGAWSNNCTFYCEHTRDSGWDTVANGYPAWVGFPLGFVYSNSIGYAPRICDHTGADVTGASAAVYCKSAIGGAFLTSAWGGAPLNTAPANAAKNILHLMIPLSCSNAQEGFLGGKLTYFSEIYATTYNQGSPLDEYIANGNSYVLFPEYTNYRILVRKG